MYINRIFVRNYRNFKFFDIALQSNITCFLGENNTGKTNLVNAIRLAIDTNTSSYRRKLDRDDFPVGTDFSNPQQVLISVEFTDFSGKPEEEALVAPCVINDNTARITYRFRPSRRAREAIKTEELAVDELSLDDYSWEIVGGGDKDTADVNWNDDFGMSIRFEELSQAFLVVFMEPLRDVEQKLKSRFSPLLKLLSPEDISEKDRNELVEILNNANLEISSNETIKEVGTSISNAIESTSGEAFKMSATLGMGSPSFDDISKALKILLTNQSMSDIEPSKNGLGMNNILYIGMLMQYFEKRVSEAKTSGQLLIIEEPEAHLHPQLCFRS